MIEKEIWKDVPGYEGYYQVSSLGRVKSLDRVVIDSRGGKRLYKGKIIKPYIAKGYRISRLSKDGCAKSYKFAQLVAIAFLGHRPNGNKLIVDHINGDRANDNVENLRLITQRANLSTGFRADRGTFSSKYIGVSCNKTASKWTARIRYKNTSFYLGSFSNEIEASKAYQSALFKIKNGAPI